MREVANTSKLGSAFDERQRAYDHFVAVLKVHDAAITAFDLLPALPNFSVGAATQLRVRRGMREDENAQFAANHAGAMIETIATEKGRGYEVIRGSALVAACGAFEYLVKATFVDQAAIEPSKAAGLLPGTKIRIRAADVLGLPVAEQWYLIADELLDQLSQSHRQMHKRIEHFFHEHVYLPQRSQQQEYLVGVFARYDAGKFDEAFLTRNCLVHNGGRIDSSLARQSGRIIGERIAFGPGVLHSLLAPLRDLAGHLNELWMQVL